MLKAKYEWEVLVEGLVKDKDLFRHILDLRQIDDFQKFFHMGKEALHDPILMDDMQKAKNRILKAISAFEPIIIYGDYDCDGITSISVMIRALRKLGAVVDFDLPDRFQDGYGLNMRAVEELIRKKVGLVITVDNGITCIEEVKALKKAGIDTIITDHHEFKDHLPDAYAIIHPKVSKNYPFKDLAGVGVAYKLASYVLEEPLDELLDLVMIGTIADLMPLYDENQALVNLGLTQLRQTENLGLKKILQHSHLDQINETAISFKIAPKINSSGRLNKAKDAVRLLISESDSEVAKLILEIEANHFKRKDLTDEATEICESLIDIDDQVLVVASSRLHEGIIGICAQKLVEKHQKSACVIYLDDFGQGKGSMRAFGDDNVLSLLKQNEALLTRFGGHSQAAGLQLPIENINQFRKQLNINSHSHQKHALKVDMEIALDDISVETVASLEKYSFFTAKFVMRNLTIKQKMKMSEKHTKFVVSSDSKTFDAVIFNSLEYYYQLSVGDVIDIVGGLSLNTWKSTTKIQVMIKDLSCNHFQVLDFRHHERYKEASLYLTDQESTRILSDVICLKEPGLCKNISIIHPETIWLLPKETGDQIPKYRTRTGLGELYRFIQSSKSVSKNKIEQRLKINPDLLTHLLAIFDELSLIDTDLDIITLKPSMIKQDVTTTKAFLQLQDLSDEIEQIYHLQESNFKSYFIKKMEVQS